MTSLPAVLLVGLGLLAPSATGQFGQFAWMLSDPAGGVAHVDDTTMSLHGLTLQEGGVISYTTTSPVAGRVSVQASVLPEEGVCIHDGLPASIAALIVDGQLVPFATCTFAGSIAVDVVEDQPFGFALQCLSAAYPYATSYAGFVFTPYWESSGGALPGVAGTPLLSGLGVLQPGEPMGVRLTRAAPDAPTTLIVGVGTATLPFKGGVLVPTPDVVLPGFTTDGSGTLELLSVWPADIPVPLLMQAWITDAAGAQGFAASNALETRVL